MKTLLLFLAACGTAEMTVTETPAPKTSEKAFTSAVATLLTFEFDAELVGAAWNPEQAAEDHLLYTIGHLNFNDGVGRLDALTLTNVRHANGVTKYHAVLPVAWAGKTAFPTTYDFTLPRTNDYGTFTEKYGHTCVDFSAHDVTSGSMWYYYRPQNCTIDAADVIKVTARVSVSNENTSAKYPEYHQLWSDDVLDVIAIFGKYEDGATTAGDAGISAFNEFVRRAKRELGAGIVTLPANVSDAPGVATPDVTFTRPGLRITALLVDNVRTAGPAFDARYNALSTNADLIVYNGHAGLGSNVRALVRKGEFVAGKYQIFFMNGCDTFAYVDGALAQTKAALNPDDPNGTKYLDMITNAMPSYFHANADNMIALVGALLDRANPKTYEQIFRGVDRAQVVVATGEEDNVYFPGFEDGEEPTTWPGIDAKATLAQNEDLRLATPVLASGTYTFTLTGTGDADLYVLTGSAPTQQVWDCRPYAANSTETCTITLTAPAAIHVLVHGYAASTVTLTGR